MQVIRHVAEAERAQRPRVAGTGTFDGMHRGHRAILAGVAACARAIGGEPIVVLERRGGDGLRLIDRRQQLEGLRDAGIVLVAFAPGAALDRALADLAVALRVVEGERAEPARGGGRLERIATEQVDGQRITAAAIAAALAGGDLQAARAMLGRDPGVAGRVVHGYHRGAALGIPTANLRVRGLQLPPDGVYAVRAQVAGRRLRGVANLGFNPTFGNLTRTVEVHLFDFSGDLYGRRIEVAFAAHVRGERKFADVTALKAQIGRDIAAARPRFERSDV